LPSRGEREPTVGELKKRIDDLQREIEKLEHKAIPIKEVSDASNMIVAEVLQKWHSGQQGGEKLSLVQDKAMVDAQRLGVIKSKLDGVRDELSQTEKALSEAKKTAAFRRE
jgi:hypothetical protein